jgi:hypothetical protein
VGNIAMTAKDKEIITFINQMPEAMKRNAINGLEFLRGSTIADYKAKQIDAAEALIIDVQKNPADYSSVILDKKIAELLGEFEISPDLEKRIMIIKHFISYRNVVKYDTDGSVEEHKNAAYDEYIKSPNHTNYMAFMADKQKKKKKR